MAQEDLDRLEIGAGFEQVRSEAVPQEVRRHPSTAKWFSSILLPYLLLRRRALGISYASHTQVFRRLASEFGSASAWPAVACQLHP
jgi:hypothetical protein